MPHAVLALSWSAAWPVLAVAAGGGGLVASLLAWGRCRRRRRRAEAALRQAQSRLDVLTEDLERVRRRCRELAVMAKSAKALRNEFLSNISHEIRTPMNTIMGMTELALAADLPPKPQRQLEKVWAAGDHLLNLLNDLLDLSRIHARRLRLDPQDFRLRDCLHDLTAKYEPLARRKGLTLTTTVAPHVPDELVGDPGRLRQTVAALLSNAVKFTDEGTIHLDVGCDPAETDVDVVLHVSVADTGVGIHPEMREAVFDAFRQADGSATRTYDGCGIGLTIASQVVALMGGRMWAQCRPEGGSRFHFTARFGIGTPALAASADSQAGKLAGVRALLVHADAEIRRSLSAALKALKMAPTEEANAEAALSALAQARADARPFQVALVDASLDRDTSGGGIERMVGEGTSTATRVVVVTHAGKRGETGRYRELGVAAYLTLPLAPETLTEALVKVLDRPASCRDAPITNHSLRQDRLTPAAI
jgi:signal transduction histidine kinase/ActR/RegA family two-component response regulator